MAKIKPTTETIDADGAELHHDLKNQPGEDGDKDHAKDNLADQDDAGDDDGGDKES